MIQHSTKWAAIGIASIGVAYVSDAAARIETINFDGLAPAYIIGDTFLEQSVRMINAQVVEYRGGNPVFGNQNTFPGGTSPNRIKAIDTQPGGGFTPPQSDPIIFQLTQAAGSFSLTGISINANGYLLRAYDAPVGGNLVASTQIFGPDSALDNTFHATLTVSAPQIWRVAASQVGPFTNYDDTIFDDAVVNFLDVQPPMPPVPEPESYLLMLAGVPILVYASKRRNRSRRD